MVEFKSKIGINRGSTRLWLEGKRLADHGWVRGTRFDVVFTEDGMVYTKSKDGKRAVAGTETRPIIDTNSKLIARFCAGGVMAKVRIEDNIIIIS